MFVTFSYDRSQACLEESRIPDYCLLTVTAPATGVSINIDFRFICRHQRRDENLVRSLQCLHDKRLPTMLLFHIADRCRGMCILDDIMTRYQFVHFNRLDIKPVGETTHISRLYCLPKSVISTCIKDIVEGYCGNMTADLVQKYLFYSQSRVANSLQSAGLSSTICDPDIFPRQVR